MSAKALVSGALFWQILGSYGSSSDSRRCMTGARTPPAEPGDPARGRRLFGVAPIKLVFALEYVLQGLANPFQGVTYQPFFRHFRFEYGLSEAATQNLFAKSYLAWSIKPILGFLIDAYGKTRTLLIGLLSAASLGYLIAPLVDTGPFVFFAAMFGLSLLLAATDVSVDRATVIVGEQEAKSADRPRSSTVGLNQAICWASIYGTGIVAAVLGGYLAERVPVGALMTALAGAPLVVLGVVLLLPKDNARAIPLRASVRAFWHGLNTGPLLGVMLFFFIFHFQPLMGALWNNHLLENLGFRQSELGLGDGASRAGSFLGVLLFVWKGVRWQERWGLRALFRVYILIQVVLIFTQFALVEPWFGRATAGLHALLPFADAGSVRIGYLISYNLLVAVADALIRMSTFSLVGAVVPVAAAGSLFAGFMSVNSLAYSLSYSTGAWLYDHGPDVGFLSALERALFPAVANSERMSIEMLILVGAAGYLLSFLAVRLVPERSATLASATLEGSGPERWRALDARVRRSVDAAGLTAGVGLFLAATLAWSIDFVTAALMSFFGITLLRKAALDLLTRRLARAA